MKLEAGKTYVFKDEKARDGYIRRSSGNQIIVDRYYNSGFTLEESDVRNTGRIFVRLTGQSNQGIPKLDTGRISGSPVISVPEIQYFKLKE